MGGHDFTSFDSLDELSMAPSFQIHEILAHACSTSNPHPLPTASRRHVEKSQEENHSDRCAHSTIPKTPGNIRRL
ncbi:hypothetical protein L484_020779 [Morus notabilis]|uniref:Uncharacterized protein n=1 Tax=Morus notabilis TaxID=981085 RepID=W9RUZ6_9ROSA|nr:hypothetical protein L484_020779 [Morus notabilis]